MLADVSRLVLLLTTSSLFGCGPLDSSANTYLDQLDPLIVENAILAERVLVLAAGLYNEEAEPARVAEAWEGEIVPLAEHLHAQASVVIAPTEWAPQHNQLVGIWSSRAEAYRDIAIAVETGDEARWKGATGKARQVKLDEEEWFRSVKNELSLRGLTVSQFP